MIFFLKPAKLRLIDQTNWCNLYEGFSFLFKFSQTFYPNLHQNWHKRFRPSLARVIGWLKRFCTLLHMKWAHIIFATAYSKLAMWFWNDYSGFPISNYSHSFNIRSGTLLNSSVLLSLFIAVFHHFFLPFLRKSCCFDPQYTNYVLCLVGLSSKIL